MWKQVLIGHFVHVFSGKIIYERSICLTRLNASLIKSVSKKGVSEKELQRHSCSAYIPESKVHGANMGPIWGRQDPGGPHVGPLNLIIWDFNNAEFTATHWNGIVDIFTKFSSLATPEVVKITTSSAASDGNFIKMMFPLECSNQFVHFVTVCTSTIMPDKKVLEQGFTLQSSRKSSMIHIDDSHRSRR